MEADRATMQRTAKQEGCKELLYENREKNEHEKSEGRQVSMLTTPSTIGVHSVALGMYLLTAAYVIGLLLVLSLISIYPLADNWYSEKFSDRYMVRTNLEDGQEAKCKRSYQSFNRITSSSYGAHCSSPEHTNSVYSCAASCLIEVDSSTTFALSSDASAAIANLMDCKSVFPCKPGVDSSNYTLTNTSTPTCCNLSLDSTVGSGGVGSVPTVQYWLLVVMLAVILLWYVFLRRKQNSTAANANLANVTPADFTVHVKGLGLGASHREDRCYLTNNFASRYGDVASAVFTTNVGTYLRDEYELKRLTELEAELERLTSDTQAGKGTGCCGGLTSWVYIRIITYSLYGSASAALQSTKIQKQAAMDRLVALKASDIGPIGEAFVTYQSSHATKEFFESQPKSMTNFLYKRFVKCRWQSHLKFKGNIIYARRAPEPTDVLWENTDSWGASLFGRRLISFLSTVLLLLIGGVLQWQLENVRSDERTKILDDYVYDDQSAEANDLTEEALQTARLQGLSMLAATVIIIINTIITYTLKWLNQFERIRTRTETEVLSVYKLTIAHMFNSIAIPLFVLSDKGSWYQRGGLAEQAFWIQVGNAIVPNFLFWLSSLKLHKHVFQRHVQTQPLMDELFRPVDVLLAERYANLIKTIILALMYSPILPLSLPIAFGAVVLTYATDAYVMLRITARPKDLEHNVVLSFNRLFLTLVPAFIIVAFNHYFYDEDSALPPFIVGMVLWGVFYFTPPKLLGIPNYSAEKASSGAENSQLSDIVGCPRQESTLQTATVYGLYAPPEPIYCDRAVIQATLDNYKDIPSVARRHSEVSPAGGVPTPIQYNITPDDDDVPDGQQHPTRYSTTLPDLGSYESIPPTRYPSYEPYRTPSHEPQPDPYSTPSYEPQPAPYTQGPPPPTSYNPQTPSAPPANYYYSGTQPPAPPSHPQYPPPYGPGPGQSAYPTYPQVPPPNAGSYYPRM